MSTNDAPKTAAIYVRISSDTQESTSLEQQEEQGRAYAAAHGWEVVQVYRDALSGSVPADRRPGLSALLEDAQRGEFSVVIARGIDRFARSTAVFVKLADDLDAMGVALVTVKESIDLTTPGGRMMAELLSVLASFERAQIAQRINDARRAHLADGRFYGRVAPFGWHAVDRTDGPGLRLALDPEQAPTLRSIVEAVIVGASVASQVDLVPLTDEGLRKLLRNEMLLGRQVVNGQALTGPEGLPMTPHDALVTWEEWKALQAAMSAAATVKHGNGRGGSELLVDTGLLHCANGHAMHINRQKDRTVYKCQEGCMSASAKGVDAAVVDQFLSAVGHLPAMLVEEQAPTLSPELEQAHERRDALRRLFVAGVITEEEMMQDMATINATIAALGAGMTSTTTSTDLGTFAEAWEASSVEERRGLLLSALVSVEVAAGTRRPVFDPERITLVWRS